MRIVKRPNGEPPSPPEETFLLLGAFGELRMWEVDDGVSTWVAAANAEHAMEVYLDVMGIDDPPDPSWTVREMSENVARKVRFIEDDGREVHSMWDEFLKTMEPCIIGSSET